MGQIIYGNEIAKDIRISLKEEIEQLKQQNKRIPKLVVV